MPKRRLSGPLPPRTHYDMLMRDRWFDDWLSLAAYAGCPPPYAEDLPPSKNFSPFRKREDADYNWLVEYLTSEAPVNSFVFRDVVDSLRRDAVDTALMNAVKEIQSLTEQLDDVISRARERKLKIRITREAMYAGRDRRWHFEPTQVRRWDDERKFERLEAAQREIKWLRFEIPHLRQWVQDQNLSLENRCIRERVYVPSER